MAVEIARSCREVSVLPDLLDLALDENENDHVRTLAISAIGDYGDEYTKASLKGVLTRRGGDPNDEIKGTALRALWPEFITAQDLFSFLTPAKPSSLVGMYRLFISAYVLPNLTPSDLPDALDWASRSAIKPGHSDQPEIDGLIDKILLLGWESVNLDGIMLRFAHVVFRRLQLHLNPLVTEGRKDFAIAIAGDSTKRRALLEALLGEVFAGSGDASILWRVCRSEDCAWIVKKATDEPDPVRAKSLLDLARRWFDYADRATFEAYWEGAQASEIVKSEFASLYLVVDLRFAASCTDERAIYGFDRRAARASQAFA